MIRLIFPHTCVCVLTLRLAGRRMVASYTENIEISTTNQSTYKERKQNLFLSNNLRKIGVRPN